MLFGPLLVSVLAVGAASDASTNIDPRRTDTVAMTESAQTGQAVDSAEAPDAPAAARPASRDPLAEAAALAADEAEQSSLQVALTRLPTQALVGVFNPATAHLSRSILDTHAELVTVAWADPGARWWQPSVTYVLERDSSPVVSGFGPVRVVGAESRPTLVSHSLATEWSFSALRMGVRANDATEHSAALGVVAPQTRASGRGAYLAWAPWQGFELQYDQGQDRVRGLSNGSQSLWNSQSLSATWNLAERLELSSSYYRGRAVPSATMPALESRVMDLNLSYSLGDGAGQAGGADARAYLRLERQALSGNGVIFTSDTPARNWAVSVGFNKPF